MFVFVTYDSDEELQCVIQNQGGVLSQGILQPSTCNQ